MGDVVHAHAVMAGDYECISLLIQKGCDVNYESSSRGTALQQACSQGDKDTITLLLVRLRFQLWLDAAH